MLQRIWNSPKICVKTLNSLRKARKITRKHQMKVMSVSLRNDMLVSKILICMQRILSTSNYCRVWSDRRGENNEGEDQRSSPPL